MRNLLIWKILLSRQGKWQLLIAGIGFCIGLLILLVAVQLYCDLKKILETQQNRENQTAYLIINKQVTLLNTFDKSVSGFSQSEWDTLRKQNFIKAAGAFQTNQFKITGNLTQQLGFSTDLFFEAIPDSFIDNKPEEFKWEEGKNFIPVIVSSEFLNLYNFGYAMTQGLPQLPAAAVQMIPFEVSISGNGKSEKFSAKVVAFSDRIPTVLVPWEFMSWANKEFGSGIPSPSRLIIEVYDAGDKRLKKFLDEKKYIANSEKLRFQKAGTVLTVVVTIAGAAGVLFVILSLVIFVLNFQLILSRAKQEVDILLNLGYTRQFITRILNLQFALIVFGVLTVALSAQRFGVIRLHEYLARHGFLLKTETTLLLVIGVIIALFMLMFNSIALRLSLR
ncbi:MAG TPA: hypothetical protein VNJ07_09750 [Chitinophagales bacterium]|nr:hypothetical protein [Chitinophagales bacterium]